MTEGDGWSRRGFLGATLAAPAIVTGCAKPPADWRRHVEGRWVGDDVALGHRVRDGAKDAAAHPP
ncbi:MAG TPA: hypothetical protein VF453_15420, partial [Burkholderiaceae bacterium]